MADLNGFVKIYRQIIKWGWYRDVPVKVLFLHCLFMANYQEDNLHGKTIERGSFVTTVDELSQQTGLTVQNTRTALNKLISTGEITKTTTNKFTVITVVNYDKFQKVNQPLTNKSTNTLTNNQQTANKQLTNSLTNSHTIIKEDKEIKNIKEDKEERGYGTFSNVLLTPDEYADLKNQFSDYESKIDYLSQYLKSSGKEYADHYATIIKWANEDAVKEIKNKQKQNQKQDRINGKPSFDIDEIMKNARSNTEIRY